MNDDQDKWLRNNHLRLVSKIQPKSFPDPAFPFYVAISSEIYYKRESGILLKPVALYLSDNYGYISCCIYWEDRHLIRTLTDSEMATEVLMGNQIITSRDNLITMYGRYDER